MSSWLGKLWVAMPEQGASVGQPVPNEVLYSRDQGRTLVAGVYHWILYGDDHTSVES